MSYFSYLFFPEKIDLKKASSRLINTMAYFEKNNDSIKGYLYWATGTNDLHGAYVLDSLTVAPESPDEAREKFMNIWKDRDEKERERLVAEDMTRYEERVDFYENEPARWLKFFKETVPMLGKAAFLITWEGSDSNTDVTKIPHESKKITDITPEFFRTIKEDVIYEILA